jgi:hypothetical protein
MVVVSFLASYRLNKSMFSPKSSHLKEKAVDKKGMEGSKIKKKYEAKWYL